MNDELLRLTLAANGADRLKQFKKLRAKVSFGGLIWQGDPRAEALRYSVFEISIGNGTVGISPFIGSKTRSVLEIHSVTLENAETGYAETRYNPAVAPHVPQDVKTWDDFQLAYILSYSFRISLASPFAFTNEGFDCEELPEVDSPFGRVKRLKVMFSARDGFHPGEHINYIMANGLICRQDYRVDLKGQIPVSCYLSEHADISGVTLASERRLYQYSEAWDRVGDEVILSTRLRDPVLV
jgi:hypothetical protein